MKKTYAIPNPFWLSDIFVFREYDKKIKTIYVKINYEGKIEEIGIDISRRMHGWELENITKHKTCTEATDVQKSILDTIGDEYWYGIYNREKVKNIMEKRKCIKTN